MNFLSSSTGGTVWSDFGGPVWAVFPARPKNFIPNFVLSPNPARDKVTLSWFEVALVDKGILDLTVYNVMGQLVLTKKINTEVKWMDLDISELTPSVYTLQLEQKGSPLYTTKFVVH
jgi:hypothetical protein